MVQPGGTVTVKSSKLATTSTAVKEAGPTAVENDEVANENERDVSKEAGAEIEAMIPGRYRVVFAVVTVSSVLVYDTQHEVRCCVV